MPITIEKLKKPESKCGLKGAVLFSEHRIEMSSLMNWKVLKLG